MKSAVIPVHSLVIWSQKIRSTAHVLQMATSSLNLRRCKTQRCQLMINSTIKDWTHAPNHHKLNWILKKKVISIIYFQFIPCFSMCHTVIYSIVSCVFYGPWAVDFPGTWTPWVFRRIAAVWEINKTSTHAVKIAWPPWQLIRQKIRKNDETWWYLPLFNKF